ncbi:hypothetical protein GGI20_001518 [Coemansia sp. BCRC 34301]|nr:hypothetical protein GGI20_001518 [Coemansia sp. BCRC 34301]
MTDKKRRKRLKKPQLPAITEPSAAQIESNAAAAAAAAANDIEQATDTCDLRYFLATNARLLRRAQSDIAPSGDKGLDDDCAWSLTSLDSGSESDLPDASSLLRTPIVPRRAGEKRPAQSQPEPKGGGKRKKKLRRADMLVKSASEIPCTAADGDLDSDSELSTIKVPGERVLACCLRKYYPARIVSRLARGKYSIQYFDDSRATVKRDRFYTQYQHQFYTCTLGAMQFAGDAPAKQAGVAAEQDVDPERDFEQDIKLYPHLVAEVEKIRRHLDALHSCEADHIAEMSAVEDRMAVFFGDDSNAKRQLSYRVSRAFLSRAEFDLLGRLLWRWYATPPSAIPQKPKDQISKSTESDLDNGMPKCVGADGDAPSSCGVSKAKLEESESSRPTEPAGSSGSSEPSSGVAGDMTDLASSTLAINFVHDVLLPHAIKRMIAERDDCSLVAAEASMCAGDPEKDWVEQIMAARGHSQENRHTDLRR